MIWMSEICVLLEKLKFDCFTGGCHTPLTHAAVNRTLTTVLFSFPSETSSVLRWSYWKKKKKKKKKKTTSLGWTAGVMSHIDTGNQIWTAWEGFTLVLSSLPRNSVDRLTDHAWHWLNSAVLAVNSQSNNNWKVYSRNKFHFSEVHGSMNTTGHVQNKRPPKGVTLTLQFHFSEVHGSMNATGHVQNKRPPKGVTLTLQFHFSEVHGSMNAKGHVQSKWLRASR